MANILRISSFEILRNKASQQHHLLDKRRISYSPGYAKGKCSLNKLALWRHTLTVGGFIPSYEPTTQHYNNQPAYSLTYGGARWLW